MKDNLGSILVFIAFAICLVIGIWITIQILHSDLPVWVKYLLLKS